jgi:signal transduction histidine kinase
MTEALATFAQKIGDKQIAVTRTDQRCIVQGLKGELMQLFSNLIANAVDAIGTDGKLEISVRHSDDDSVAVRIHDNGPGIPQHQKARLFEPFFTTKEKHMGTGLGLWISKEIAQKHEAQISLESSTSPSSHGTTFTVTFTNRNVSPPAETP